MASKSKHKGSRASRDLSRERGNRHVIVEDSLVNSPSRSPRLSPGFYRSRTVLFARSGVSVY